MTIVTTAQTDEEARELLRAARHAVQGGVTMAKTSLIRSHRPRRKFKVRDYTRCKLCGRPRAVFRKFGLCRICLRELAHQGESPA